MVFGKTELEEMVKNGLVEAAPVLPPDQGAVVKVPEVGGLHHHYERMAA